MFRVSLFAVVALTLTFAAGAHFAQKKPGSEPYTPTRLEWLSVELNSGGDLAAQLSGIVAGGYRADPATDTITCWIIHKPDAEHRIVKFAADMQKLVVQEAAKKRGWTGWLRIAEDIKPPPQIPK